MSLTKITEPSLSINSAYDMVVYDYTSNRDGSDAESVTSVADSGGFSVYTVASHSFVVGDNITGSSFSESTYNVAQTVTAQTSTTITTNVAYVSNVTGTITMTNSDFQVGAKCGILGTNSTENINDVNSGGTTSGISSIEDGLSIIVLDNEINSTDVSIGDLIYATNLQSDLNGVHVVRGVSGGATSSEITIYVKSTTITDTAGNIELLGSFNGTYPEKVISALDVSGTDTYRFNFSNIFKSIISYDLLPIATTNITDVTNGIKTYGVAISEYHNDKDGLLVESPDTSFYDKEYTNNIFQYADTLDCDDFKTNASTNDGKFLTNAPSSLTIKSDESFQLSIYSPDTTDLKVAYVTYDLNGSAASVAYLALVNTTSNKVAFPINSNILSTSISKVDVWLVRDSDNVQLTNKQTFVLDTKCSPNAKRIFWQNEKGGFDAFTFTNNYEVDQKTKGSSYVKPLDYGYSIGDRGSSIIQNKVQDKFSISTNPLKRATRDWLKEIRQSDEVYVVENNQFIPIIITGGLDRIHDDISLISMDIEYVYANETKTQLG